MSLPVAFLLVALRLSAVLSQLLPEPTYARTYQFGIYTNFEEGVFDETAELIRAAAGLPRLEFAAVSPFNNSDSLNFDYLLGPPIAEACSNFRAASFGFITRYGTGGYAPVANLVRRAVDPTTNRNLRYASSCGLILRRKGSAVTIDSHKGFHNLTVALVHPLVAKLGSLQMLHILREYGIDVLAESRRILMSFDFARTDLVVRTLLDGTSDLAFIGMAAPYRLMELGQITPEEYDRLEIVERKTYPNYPLPCTTKTVPESVLYVAPWVPLDEISRVRDRLLKINEEDTAAVAGRYSGWVTPLSELPSALSPLALKQLGTNDFFLQCPNNISDPFSLLGECALPGYFKLSRAAFQSSCANDGQECPAGFTCVCRGCRKLPTARYRVFGLEFEGANNEDPVAYFSLLERLSFASETLDEESAALVNTSVVTSNGQLVTFAECKKLQNCLTGTEFNIIELILFDVVIDHTETLGLNATTTIEVAAAATVNDAPVFQLARPLTDPSTGRTVWIYDLTLGALGTYLVKIRADGEDIEHSPFFITAKPVDCPEGYVPTVEGLCVRKDGSSLNIPGLVTGTVVGPILLAIAITVLVCILIRRKEAARWRVNIDEIIFTSLSGDRDFKRTHGTYHGSKVQLIAVGKRSTKHVSAKVGEPLTFLTVHRFTGPDVFPSLESEFTNDSSSQAQSDSPTASSRKKGATSLSMDLSSPTALTKMNQSFSAMAQRMKSTRHMKKVPTSSLIKEISHACRVVRHSNLAILHGFTFNHHLGTVELCLVEEFSTMGTLEDLLEVQSDFLQTLTKLQIVRDCASGMAFLHRLAEPIAHGSLTPSAILIEDKDEKLQAKVGFKGRNFGMPLAMQPDFLTQDIHDFGCILARLFMQHNIDPNQNLEVMRLLAEKSPQEFSDMVESASCSVRIKSLIIDCFDPIRSNRPPFYEIVKIVEREIEAEKQNVATQTKEIGIDATVIRKIFPPTIAHNLIHGLPVHPEFHDEVSILFSDIVGFTEIAANLDPRDVQPTLDSLFRKFDERVTHHDGLFRVEIIGDAYLICSNLVKPLDDHTAKLALMAQDMVEIAKAHKFIKRRRDAQGNLLPVSGNGEKESYDVKIRIGIHVGPAVATVLGGIERPRFALMGDTINTASRTEANSLPLRINLTSVAACYIRKQSPELGAILRPRKPIKVKGKGIQHFFFLGGDPDPEYDPSELTIDEETPLQVKTALQAPPPPFQPSRLSRVVTNTTNQRTGESGSSSLKPRRFTLFPQTSKGSGAGKSSATSTKSSSGNGAPKEEAIPRGPRRKSVEAKKIFSFGNRRTSAANPIDEEPSAPDLEAGSRYAQN